MAVPSFLFGGTTNETPSSIKQKRDLVRALMGASNAPRNIGEGLNALGDGIVANVLDRRANEAEAKGTSAANDLFNSILGTGTPAATMPTTTGAGQEMGATSPAVSPSGGPEAYRNAIASIESAGSGDYAAVGPTHPKLGRALGRYQIMETNIGPWSQEALGRAVTPEEFMADPKLQDAIFDKKFGGYVQQYGPEGAAQAWIGGPGGVGKLGRKDSLGTSVGAYGSKFLNALGPQVAAATPQAAMEAAAPASGYVDPMVSAPNSMAAQPGMSQVPPLDPPRTIAPPPQVAQVAPQQHRPAQAPQNGAFGGVDPRILQALQNPFINEGQRQALQMVAKQQMEANDPLRQLQMQEQEMKLRAMQNPGPEYDFIPGKDGSIFRTEKRTGTIDSVYGGKPDRYRTLTDAEEQQYGLDPSKAYQIGADEKIQQIGGGGTTVNIDQKAEGAFDKKLAEKQAETFDAMATEGMNARADLGVINELDGLLQGQGGTLTGLAGIAAKYGIGGKDMGDLQAANAIINRLIPSQRAPGSGSMSDRDVEMFTRSLPSLWNQPGGNSKIINVMRGLTQYKQQQGEIADQVITGDMTRQEARRALRALPNPLEEFRNQGQQKKPAVIDGYTIEEAE